MPKLASLSAGYGVDHTFPYTNDGSLNTGVFRARRSAAVTYSLRDAQMANKEHVRLLKRSVAAWNTWRDKNPDIRPDLREANLTGADLSEANLTGADLSEAKLLVAKLRGANLSRA